MTTAATGAEKTETAPPITWLWTGHGWKYEASLLAGGVALIALLAQVAVTLPFTRVPITGQTLGVALTGAFLGCRRGPLAVLLYLCAGLAGLPVFAGGTSGAAKLTGPTGGYLLGFVLAAGVVGYAFERGWGRRYVIAWLIFALGDSLIFLCGLTWLARFTGWHAVLAQGFWPFLPGAWLKSGLSALLLTALRRRFAPDD